MTFREHRAGSAHGAVAGCLPSSSGSPSAPHPRDAMTRPRPLLERLERLTQRTPDCWEWVGARTPAGYGQITIRDPRKANRYAHRVVYEALVGPIPEGMTIDHLCRNRGCVNPAHLEPVTPRENTLRGNGPTALNARKDRCVRGHLLAGSNLTTADWRQCRECKRMHKADRRLRLAAERLAPAPTLT